MKLHGAYFLSLSLIPCTDPELYNDSEDEGEEDDWDLAAFRKRTEEEREEFERRRLEAMGHAPVSQAQADEQSAEGASEEQEKQETPAEAKADPA